MVFHTAPPQPASNARCTCAPELVGGADASQKGLGDRMPANWMLRSAMFHRRETNMNRLCRELAVLHGHDGGRRVLGSDAIAAGKHAGNAGLKVCIDLDKPPLHRKTERTGQRG